MRVRVIGLMPQDPTRSLFLEPESDRDQTVLSRLLADGFLSGMGKDPETGRFLHGQVRLNPIADQGHRTWLTQSVPWLQ